MNAVYPTPHLLSGIRCGGVLVTHGMSDVTEHLIRTVKSLPILLVVIDSGSSAEDRSRLEAAIGDSTNCKLRLFPNLGFAAAANEGVRGLLDVGCDVLLLLNPDVEAKAQDLLRLIELAAERENVLLSPLIVDPADRVWFAGARWKRFERLCHVDFGVPVVQVSLEEGYSPFLPFTCVAGRAEVFRRVGPLPEKYFLYWEDVVWARRALAADVCMKVESSIRVRHIPGHTSGGGESPTFLYYSMRNSTVDVRERHSAGYVAIRCVIVVVESAARVALKHDRRWKLQLLAIRDGVRDGASGRLSRTGPYEGPRSRT